MEKYSRRIGRRVFSIPRPLGPDMAEAQGGIYHATVLEKEVLPDDETITSVQEEEQATLWRSRRKTLADLVRKKSNVKSFFFEKSKEKCLSGVG